MPVNITDVSEFTSPLTAPVGTDSRDTAANVVEAFLQVLGNRTRYVKDVHEALDAVAAKLGVANTFTRGQQIDIADNPGEALIRTTKTSLDSTTNPGNGWKVILECKADPTSFVRVYTGANAPSGHFAVTVNAYWSVSGTYASKWRQDDVAQASFALMVIGTVCYVTSQPAGASPWSSWPSNQGQLNANTLHAVGSVVSDAGMQAVGEYSYASPISRSQTVPVASFVGASYSFVPGSPGSSATHIACTNANGTPCVIPLRVPVGCTTFSITASFNLNGSIASDFRVVAMKADYTVGGASNDVQMGNTTSAAAPGDAKKTILISAGSPHTLDVAAEQYLFHWVAGQVGDKLYGLKVTGWNDSQIVRGW